MYSTRNFVTSVSLKSPLSTSYPAFCFWSRYCARFLYSRSSFFFLRFNSEAIGNVKGIKSVDSEISWVLVSPFIFSSRIDTYQPSFCFLSSIRQFDVLTRSQTTDNTFCILTFFMFLRNLVIPLGCYIKTSVVNNILFVIEYC